MSMRKILNEWRSFALKESKRAPDVAYNDDNLEPDFSVYHEADDETHAIILYRKQKYVDGFYIIGYIAVDLLTDPGDKRFPCIPDTYQVPAIYVEPELQGQDFGRLMYSLGFAVLDNDEGITSDKYSGTMPKAKEIWKKMEKSSEYEKRETPKGSDEFDYTGKTTPNDKMDDCLAGLDLGDTNATDHSLKKKNNSMGKALLVKYKAQHEQNDFLNKTDVENKLMNRAIGRFGEIYSQMTNYS
jgi:GNAT superfamily N-acetyltransferase